MSTATQQVKRSETLPLQAWVAGVRHWLVLAGVLVVVGAFNLSYLMRTPAAFVDEGWNANRAWGLLQTGRAFGTLDSGVFERYDGYWTVFPWIGTAIHSAFLALFGPELIAVRLASLVFGLLLLVSVYTIGRCLYGARAGLLAVLLLSVSTAYLYSSHLGRHDIMVAAAGFGAIALFVTDGSRDFSARSMLSGLAAGLAVDIHPNAVLFIPAILALYIASYGLGTLRVKQFWGFAVGLGIAGLAFLALHIIPYPQSYFALLGLGQGSTRAPALLSLDPGFWVASLAATLNLLGWLWVPLIAVAYAVLLKRGSVADKRTLVLFTMLIVAYLVVIRSHRIFYAIILVPAAALLLAAFVDKLLSDGWRGSLPRYVRFVGVVGLLASSAVISLVQATFYDMRGDYNATLRDIRSAVPSGSTILGPQTYWFAMTGERYLSWEQIIYYRRATPGSSVEEALTALRPDYMIIDRFMEGAIIDTTTRAQADIPFLNIPAHELESFLSARGRLVSSIETEEFGNVRTYELDWSKSGRLSNDHPTAGLPGGKEARP